MFRFSFAGFSFPLIAETDEEGALYDIALDPKVPVRWDDPPEGMFNFLDAFAVLHETVQKTALRRWWPDQVPRQNDAVGESLGKFMFEAVRDDLLKDVEDQWGKLRQEMLEEAQEAAWSSDV